ncbi:MAG: hypothetical protein DMG77_06390 [Acidobacteria bacterium]|nr:MAG: hypothetical protein DMG77_06390 [Acidobacteriota bacterium]
MRPWRWCRQGHGVNRPPLYSALAGGGREDSIYYAAPKNNKGSLRYGFTHGRGNHSIDSCVSFLHGRGMLLSRVAGDW